MSSRIACNAEKQENEMVNSEQSPFHFTINKGKPKIRQSIKTSQIRAMMQINVCVVALFCWSESDS